LSVLTQQQICRPNKAVIEHHITMQRVAKLPCQKLHDIAYKTTQTKSKTVKIVLKALGLIIKSKK